MKACLFSSQALGQRGLLAFQRGHAGTDALY